MSQQNRPNVDKIINVAEDGLQEIVLKQYKQRYSANAYLRELSLVLDISPPLQSEEQAKEAIESPGWLHAIWYRKEVFTNKLGMNRNVQDYRAKDGFNYVSELINARNRYSHRNQGNSFTDEDVYSLADTATRLLLVVKATEEAAITEETKLEYGRRLYGVQANEDEPAPDEVSLDESEDQSKASETADPDAEVNDEEPPRRVDLSGLNLSGMDLRGRNLHLANLKGVDLTGSNMYSANLADMDLSDVKLSKADLSEANLTSSRLHRADLSDAILRNGDLTRANLSFSILKRADLRSAKIDWSRFTSANLEGADLSNSKEQVDRPYFAMDTDTFDSLHDELSRWSSDFSHAILRKANMQRLWLECGLLTGADMTEANLAGARITGCDFSGARLNSADLSQSDIIECDFTGAKMQGIVFTDALCGHSTKFTNADMTGANLVDFECPEHGENEEFNWNNVDLSRANLRNAILTVQSLRNVKLIDANLTSADLMGSDLSNADLTRAVFKDASLNDANLSNTDLNETNFTGADLTCADFTGAKFYPLSTVLPDGSYWDANTDITYFTGDDEIC